VKGGDQWYFFLWHVFISEHDNIKKLYIKIEISLKTVSVY
jgi:hypothetical protein